MDAHKIEATGMLLANRAYLYGIFHIVFGANVTSEELRLLSCPETLEAFAYMRDADETAGVAFETASKEGVQQTSAKGSFARALQTLNDFGRLQDDSDYVNSLNSAYSRLFVTPGKSYVYPWESPYIGKEMMLFQESTLDVRRRYAEHGFAVDAEGNFPEDHVAMMLHFQAQLCNQAFDAYENGRDVELAQILASQKEFNEVHLGGWLLRFHEALCKKDDMGTFCQFAEALRAFIAVDNIFLDKAADGKFT